MRDQGLPERARRMLSPSYGARANAAESMDELAENAEGAVVLSGADVALRAADVALISGHPVGLTQRRAAGRLGTALWEVFPAHVALLDRDGVLVSVNAAWRRFALERGGRPTAGLGLNYVTVCERASAEHEPEAAEAAALVRDALAGVASGRRLTYRCDDRWFTMQALPIPGRFSGALVVHTDVTEDHENTQRWRHRALHDALTGLPNRALLEDRLEQAVSRAERAPGSLGVMFVGLDDFTAVNDAHGHAVGDRVLQQVAARLAGSVRAGDTIGRWGGDTFLVVAEHLDPSASVGDLVGRLLAGLEAPIDVDGRELPVSAAVGVADLGHGRRSRDLVDAADRALQAAKAARGRRTHRR